ncbi:DUF3052 family protein [Streptomyces rubiginosohelvolus]|uniref:DUF3052 family protein n=1 Tax=Streptomyces rubiginosohelvolus TaxID=67362 RepID=UPI00365622E2
MAGDVLSDIEQFFSAYLKATGDGTIFKSGQDVLEISDPLDFDDQAQALRKAIEARTGTPLESADEGLVYGGAECDAAVAWWRQGERSLNDMLVRLRDEYLRENGYVLLITPAQGQDGHWNEGDLGLAGHWVGVGNLGKKPYEPEGATWVASLLIRQQTPTS